MPQHERDAMKERTIGNPYRLVLITLAFLLVPCAASADDAAVSVEQRPGLMEQLEATGEPQVVQKDGWKLETEVLQPGTRSQGYHGVLYHDGKPVPGERMGQTMDTPLGTLRFGGTKMDRNHLWDHTGWKLMGQEAGKPSCPGPNMRTAPKRGKGGRPPGAALK